MTIWQCPEQSEIAECSVLVDYGVLVCLENGNIYVVPVESLDI